MKHPKHIQEIIDTPSCLPGVKKHIKESQERCKKIMKETEKELRGILNC